MFQYCTLLFSILCFFTVSLKAQLAPPANIAFQDGEEIIMNIHYGIINVGYLKMKAEIIKNKNNNIYYKFLGEGKTYPAWDMFYKVRDYYFSYVDTSTLFPVFAQRKVREDKTIINESIIFDQKKNLAKISEKSIPIPDTTFDLLSAIYYIRCLDFSKIPENTEIHFNSVFDKDLFPIAFIYQGKQIIETKLGTFRSLVIKPKLIEGRIFKGQYDMTVYVSDDLNHIPLRVETAIFVGYIRADLTKYKKLKYPLNSKLKRTENNKTP
jgi:hypothetical protein